MKRLSFCFAILAFAQIVFSQRVDNIELGAIATDISQYRNKTLTLMLKLKNLDRIFERITFYDAKNHDIEFDISAREIRKKLRGDMLNLHEGLDYYVTFKVNDVGNLGLIIAEIFEFKPVLIHALPEK